MALRPVWTVSTKEVSCDPHKFMAVAKYNDNSATYIGDEQESRAMVKTKAVRYLKEDCKKKGIFL